MTNRDDTSEVKRINDNNLVYDIYRLLRVRHLIPEGKIQYTNTHLHVTETERDGLPQKLSQMNVDSPFYNFAGKHSTIFAHYHNKYFGKSKLKLHINAVELYYSILAHIHLLIYKCLYAGNEGTIKQFLNEKTISLLKQVPSTINHGRKLEMLTFDINDEVRIESLINLSNVCRKSEIVKNAKDDDVIQRYITVSGDDDPYDNYNMRNQKITTIQHFNYVYNVFQWLRATSVTKELKTELFELFVTDTSRKNRHDAPKKFARLKNNKRNEIFDQTRCGNLDEIVIDSDFDSNSDAEIEIDIDIDTDTDTDSNTDINTDTYTQMELETENEKEKPEKPKKEEETSAGPGPRFEPEPEPEPESESGTGMGVEIKSPSAKKRCLLSVNKTTGMTIRKPGIRKDS